MSTELVDRWRARVEALSPAQRRSLAEQLRQQHGTSAARRLIGFVVPAVDSSPSLDSLRAFLAERLPDYMVPSRLVGLERLPRTAAGKLDRAALALAYDSSRSLTQESAAVRVSQERKRAESEHEATLLAIWREVLKVDDIDIDDDFFEIGGDSLLSIRVIAKAGRAGLRIPPQQFFEHPTVRHMAAAASAPPVSKLGAGGDASQSGAPAATDRVGAAPLTPIQHWFLDAIPEHRDWWNQGYILSLGRVVEVKTLRDITRTLVEHHDALRLRLVEDDGTWQQQFLAPGDEVPFRAVNLGTLGTAERSARVLAEADKEHASLRLSDGALFRVVLFFTSDGWQRVLLVSHHVVVDGVSWGVILDDLATLISQAQAGQPLQLAASANATSARQHALALRAQSAAEELAATASHWLSLPAGGGAMPIDDGTLAEAGEVHDARALSTTNADADVVSVTLGAEMTRAVLHEAPRRLDVSAQSVLLAALLLSWKRWTGHDALWLDIEGHGRDAPSQGGDLSHTVGWFTTVFPVRLSLPAQRASGTDPDPATVADAVERSIDALPMRGAAHGLLRFLSPNDALRERLAALPRPTLLFNYLGAHDVVQSTHADVRVTDEYAGQSRSPHAARPYLLELNASSRGGTLVVTIEFARHVHRQETMHRFASLLLEALEALATATPKAATVAGLDSDQLNTVAALLGALDESDELPDEENS